MQCALLVKEERVMLGAHLGNLCLLGSHRGIVVEEYEDAVILLRELVMLLEYHTLYFSGGWGQKKNLYNLPLQFLIERCHFQHRQKGKLLLVLLTSQ